MNRLRYYITANLSTLFISIFLPLFAIASVILFIKLATYTAVIQLSVWEMTKLYIFRLPEILFYTLPVTFFIAAALSLLKLSNDNEIVVIFALGIKPSYIIKTLLKPALLLSMVLMLDFFILFPHATVLSSNFVSYKKSEAKFNLAASEFGNSFGDWLLYLGKKESDGSFSKVFLFNKKEKEEILIAAKRAKLLNDSGILRLKLFQGEGYSYSKEKFTQINFETMLINDTMKTNMRTYKKPLDFWLSNNRAKEKKQMLITDFLLSIFPIINLFLVVSLGIVHARHGKSQIYFYLFVSIVLYYGATIGLQSLLGFYTIPTVIFSWLIVTYTIYRKTILSRF
ncbi:LptF/LptG family permease [Sulfurimonas sp. SAG-AH-194-C20]|nr:LptF/LptG family permease [Sulfurimonas sp. SAG-AH-194-C20]MDF1879126.1 LptF/LptG family permease [Sulfurimonas sp. SAG-AH-194-C20]